MILLKILISAYSPPYFVLQLANVKARIEAEYKDHAWNHLCLVIENDQWRFYLNGAILEAKTFNKSSDLEGGGVLILGQDQDSLGGGFEQQKSYSGSISLFNLWNESLNSSEIKAMKDCNNEAATGNGNIIVSWRQNFWSLGQQRILSNTINLKDFCHDDTEDDFTNIVVFPERIERKEATQLCLSFGASVVLPQTETENKAITELAGKFRQICEAENQSGKTIWLGIESNGNLWLDSRNQTPISYSNFITGSGRGDDNCAYLITGDSEEANAGHWGSTLCSQQIPR